ncbi:MAG: potassium transporter TrkG [bacterium]
MNPKIADVSPGRILIASFLFVISLGTFLLSLPASRVVNIPFIDILFTAASATCVTGLQVVPIYYFSFFGKCVILSLIQIGGLGLMTLSFFLVSLILRMRFSTQVIAGQLLEFESADKVKTFLSSIISITVITELIGAILLYPSFKELFATKKAVFYSVFHSISAFCNSGVSLFENNMADFAKNPFPLSVLSLLVFLGGIGFIVWYEMINLVKKFIRSIKRDKTPIYSVSLHTKIALNTSLILIGSGTIIFWFLEKGNALRSLGFINKFVNSFFIASTVRCAGFQTVSVDELALPTLLILMILMFIGASPSSTGSGIKTTTFALFIASIASIVRNRTSIEIGGRTIPNDQVYKATAIVSLALGWLLFTIFLLLITEKSFSFIQVFFEATAAFSTGGLSTGITPYLSKIGKLILMISMVVGRMGSLTLVLALIKKKEKQLYRYPEERIIIG